MMQIVEYTEAVDLTMHGMHDDIYVMHPVAISSMTMQDVRAAAEAGAVFAVMKQPQKEPEPKAEAKPTPPPEAPCRTGP
jgi:outer membrane biosynthesis protein TonB